MDLNFVEVFSSIQGEGLYVGCRQLFIRLSGCNLNCAYCDTPTSRTDAAFGLIEQTAGQRDFLTVSNPIPSDELIRHAERLLALRHHSVSLTGGEPLCQAAAVAEIGRRLNAPIYLETNGTMPDALAEVLPHVSIVSMDIKLPSVTGRELWEEHRHFLELASCRGVFVKLVLSGESGDEELDQAFSIISSVDKAIPLILQPVTPNGGVSAASPERVLAVSARAMEVLDDVRVIPQTHKFIGQL